ncbi:MAG: M23 family metallopeptidase [Ruminococcus sp.]|nr:M23 family metallopeptidase [Ruminococcus sp.]
MNSPYMGKFQVTQEFKGQSHDGLDLVGLDSKEIHSTVNGIVHYAGWENCANHSQGFGQFVCIKGTDARFYYFGHLSEIRVNVGDAVKITDVIGIEGNTGYSTGSHCHYCARPQFSYGNALNISEISGIPNVLGIYDDGYATIIRNSVNVTLSSDGITYTGSLTEK